MNAETDPNHKAGYAAIIGKPNAGKSTLMNTLLGAKLSIITNKPQTTRNQVVGIYSDEDSQIIFLDTPGLINPRYGLQESMMRAVNRARSDADVVLHLVDGNRPTEPEQELQYVSELNVPVLLVINKTDLAIRDRIESCKQQYTSVMDYAEILEVSAMQAAGTGELMDAIKKRMPLSPPYYPKDQLSEHPERFFISEMIREHLFIQFRQEIPYSCAINIVDYVEDTDMDHIQAEIIVDRKSQKGMLIGKGGKALKKLGTAARREIEAFLDKKVNLQLFVKVREKWRDKPSFLRSFGYD